MHLTIVIPTYNEKDNVRRIAARIMEAMRGWEKVYEILFVDDSTDDTPSVLAELAVSYPEVTYRHRDNERGLASAVVEGFKTARGQHIIVMDADLQHPPELIPLILRRLEESDIVIPSRFIDGGSDGGLSGVRKFISFTARMLGRLSISRLRHISDCTGGYFGIRRSVVEDVPLNPIGWKILMEVLVKGRYSTVHEIPYAFDTRHAGESKMSLREQWNYLLHIARLIRHSPDDRRFYLFCFVGTLGVFVNLIILNLLLTYAVDDGLTASLIASLAAMAHNFFWNDNWTWKDHQNPIVWRRVLQFPQFAAVCGVGVGITALMAQIFVGVGWNIYAGQLFGILLATCWSYAANNRWTWSKERQDNIYESKLVVTQERG